MTPDEIQALRERHQNDGDGCCDTCMDTYPCDVTQVLDALHKQWRLTNLAYGEGHKDGYDKGLAIGLRERL